MDTPVPVEGTVTYPSTGNGSPDHTTGLSPDGQRYRSDPVPAKHSRFRAAGAH